MICMICSVFLFFIFLLLSKWHMQIDTSHYSLVVYNSEDGNNGINRNKMFSESWCREEHPPRREPIGLLGQFLGKELWFMSSRAAVGRSACGEGAEKDCILSTTSKSSFKWNQPYTKPSFKWHLTSSSSLIRFVPWSPHLRFPFFQAPFPDTSFYMKISLSSGQAQTHDSHFLCLDHCWENWVLPMPAYCHLSMRFLESLFRSLWKNQCNLTCKDL